MSHDRGCFKCGEDVSRAACARMDCPRRGDAAEIGQRAAHYGAGRQPWDDILDQGWGPAFAAGNALKYVRRYKNKNGEDDLKKGRWYYRELLDLACKEQLDYLEPIAQPVNLALMKLDLLLTEAERALLRGLLADDLTARDRWLEKLREEGKTDR